MRPNIKASRILPIAAIGLLLALAGCKSKNLPSFPTSTPTPPSAPSSSGLPKPPSGGMPSPPSSSPPSSSPPSSSPPSQGGKTSSSPSSPSLPGPGLPDPTAGGKSGSKDVAKGPKGPKGSKGGSEQSQGKPSGAGSEGGDQRENRTQAGDDLQRAGEQIARAGSGEIDPLIPQTDSDSNEEGDVFADSSSASASDSDAATESGGASGASDDEQGAAGSQVADSGQSGGGSPGDAASEDGMAGAGMPGDGNPAGSDQPGGTPGSQASTSESSGDPSGGGIPADLADDIRRAQEALAKAGGALQEAGAAVSSAETDEELAAAEELLSKARIAVIIASQDLEGLEGDIKGTPGWGEAEDELFQETSEALQNANIALVIATRSVLIAKTGSAEMPGGVPAGGVLVEGNGEVAALEDELDESLVIFDGQIGDAREAVLSTAPPPETASGNGQRSDERPDGETGEMMRLPPDSVTKDEPTEQVATAEMPDMNQGDIPDAQGDDIVAQQLREAAMAESDPDLQAKLWEEYKRYKEGL